jgi:LacI family transcriptional regulator
MEKSDSKSVHPAKRITIRDLARELGVSNQAVSQALNPTKGNIRLKPSTAERIRKFAAEQNYRPDSRARSMRYGRFYNIGFFQARKGESSWAVGGPEAGVLDVASENHYRVVLIHTPSGPEDEKSFVPSAFREGNLDALIVSQVGILSLEVKQAIETSGFPVIYINEKKERNSVYIDDVAGAEELTRHLISLGNRHIVYLNANSKIPHYSEIDRLAGYRRIMKEAGLKTRVLKVVDTAPDWERNLAAWFSRRPEVEAVMAYNDYMAIQFYRTLINSRLGIPKNLAVAAFGNVFAEALSPVKMTTMKLPYYEMGRAAAEMALSLVNSNQKSVPSRSFPPRLIVRDSTFPRSSRSSWQNF